MRTIEQSRQAYMTMVQVKAQLTDTQNLFGELGRGSGKSTNILAPRFVRVCYSMPRSTVALAGPSYTFVMDTIAPAVISYLNQYYKRGIFFEYGKRPPKWFKEPLVPIENWKHTISFAWGTVARFIGVDRPDTSGIGQNMAHIFVDELLRINETNFMERLVPAQRGNRQIFGHSPYFGGITGFSSTPNYENDHDWWLSFEKNQDEQLLKEIMDVALDIEHNASKIDKYEMKREKAIAENDAKRLNFCNDRIRRLKKFNLRWSAALDEKRKGGTTYLKGSSFTNLAVLGLDYIKNQYKASRHNMDKFKLSILGIRPKRITDMFFSRFDKKNIYTDSYKYDRIDVHEVGSMLKSSEDLKYCDSKRPLLAGYDPGGFQSIVFAQETGKKMFVFKNMYVYSPESQHELAEKINHFFRNHKKKVIYLYPDRAGNQRKEKYRTNQKGKTDNEILSNELRDLGWIVHIHNPRQRTIMHWEHFMLFERLMAEREKNLPKIRICQYECEELVSCIYNSPLKKTMDSYYELDKSSERKLDFADQVWFSTQLPSALMYLVFEKYEKLVPNSRPHVGDISRL